MPFCYDTSEERMMNIKTCQPIDVSVLFVDNIHSMLPTEFVSKNRLFKIITKMTKTRLKGALCNF